MEPLLFLFLLVIFILLLIFNSNTHQKLDKTANQLFQFRSDVSVQFQLFEKRHKELLAKIAEQKSVIQPDTIIPKEEKKEESIISVGKIEEIKVPEIEPVKEPVNQILETKQDIIEKTEPISTVKQEEVKKEIPVEKIVIQPFKKEEPIRTPPVITKPPQKKKADFEKFVGEKLISYVGIVILVLGVAFFVKFAIDQGWINEVARVAIGILAGGVLIGLAHYLRLNFRAFSSVLAGGGLAVLYFTIAFGFQMYHLFSQPVAFVLMVGITGFAILLSLAYDRKELAIFAILGGFASPFMVATGAGNYIVLFTYIAILNIGMLILAYFKKWNLVNIVSFVCTLLLYGSWLTGRVLFDMDNPPYAGALFFATLFYIVFFLMNIINNVKLGEKFTAFEIIMMLSNSFFYFTAGMLIIHKINPDYKGLFTASLAVFNFIFAYILYKNSKADKTLVYSLIAMVLTFLSLAAPIQLQGNNITLFWAAEAVALLWLSQKAELKIVKIGSGVVTILMIVSLMMNWQRMYFPNLNTEVMPIIFNKGFITSIVSVLAMVALLILLKNDKDVTFVNKFSNQSFMFFIIVFIIIALYISCLLELNYQLDNRIAEQAVRDVFLALYNFVFLFGTLMWTKINQIKYVFPTITGLSLFGTFVYLTYYYIQYTSVRELYLHGQIESSYYIFHLLTVIFILSLSFLTWTSMQKLTGEKSGMSILNLCYSVFVVLFVLSTELDNWVLFAQFREGFMSSEILQQNHKIGYPILWGISAFALMILGMKKKEKTFRIISLVIFLFTLIKLFAWDLRGISEGGKIAAFISLGVLLLVLAFMYQKLKKLLFEDEEEPSI